MTDSFIDAWVGDGNTRVYKDTKGNLIVKSEGSRAWRNNNPGNMGKKGFSDSHGAISDDGTFAIFPSLEVGNKAQFSLLKSPAYQKSSLKDALYKYAPPNENNTEAYLKFIEDKTGVDRDAQMNSLSDKQISDIQNAMVSYEELKPGKEELLPSNSEKNTQALIKQPSDKFTEQDVNRLIASPAYRNKVSPLHNRVRQIVDTWHKNHYGSDAKKDKTDQTTPSKPPTSKKPPSSAKSDNNKDNGSSKGSKDGQVHVRDYWRRKSARAGKSKGDKK